MTTFTTTIDRMYTMQQPSPNYVVNVLWTVTGVDGEHTAFFEGDTQFNSADQESAFIPYGQLTEATVLGWIPASQIEGAKANVQGQIDKMITPPVSPQIAALPWVQAS